MADVTFLADGGMDFAVRCVLSGAPYATAEPGEVLAGRWTMSGRGRTCFWILGARRNRPMAWDSHTERHELGTHAIPGSMLLFH